MAAVINNNRVSDSPDAICSDEGNDDSSVFVDSDAKPLVEDRSSANNRRKRIPIAKKIHRSLEAVKSHESISPQSETKEQQMEIGRRFTAPLAAAEPSISVEDALQPESSGKILASRSSGDGQEETCDEFGTTDLKEKPPNIPQKCHRKAAGMDACLCCSNKKKASADRLKLIPIVKSEKLSPFVCAQPSGSAPVVSKALKSRSSMDIFSATLKETPIPMGKEKRSIVKESIQLRNHLLSNPSITSSLFYARSSMDIGPTRPKDLDEKYEDREGKKESKIENFLVGPGGSALLGKEELLAVLPDQKVKVFLGSWNIASLPINEDLSDNDLREWLKDGVISKAHIFALGIQEGPVQILDSSYPEDLQERIQHCLGDMFLFLVAEKMGVQVLMIFIHRSLIWFISVPSTDSVRTNSVNVLQYCARTKGAAAVVFRLFRTSMLFISCHFSYGVKSDGRVQDYKKIVENLKFKDYPLKPGAEDAVESFDNVFWMGDLNFKLEQERSIIEALMLRAPVMVESILHKDQLKKEIKSGSIFHGFHEAEIKFHPTYKYDLGTNKLDSSSKNRVPAYTDRILYKRNLPKKEGKIDSLRYNSAHSVCFSDHKPVYSILRVPIKAGASKLPLFASNLSSPKPKSALCKVM